MAHASPLFEGTTAREDGSYRSACCMCHGGCGVLVQVVAAVERAVRFA